MKKEIIGFFLFFTLLANCFQYDSAGRRFEFKNILTDPANALKDQITGNDIVIGI
jgi:hypothetical protein